MILVLTMARTASLSGLENSLSVPLCIIKAWIVRTQHALPTPAGQELNGLVPGTFIRKATSARQSSIFIGHFKSTRKEADHCQGLSTEVKLVNSVLSTKCTVAFYKGK